MASDPREPLWCTWAIEPSHLLRTWRTLVVRARDRHPHDRPPPSPIALTGHQGAVALVQQHPDAVVVPTLAADSWAALTVAVCAARDRGHRAVLVLGGDVVPDLDPALLAAVLDGLDDDLVVGAEAVRTGSRSGSAAPAAPSQPHLSQPHLSQPHPGQPHPGLLAIGCRTPLVVEPRLVGPGGWGAVEHAVAARGGAVRFDDRLRAVDAGLRGPAFAAYPWRSSLRNELIAAPCGGGSTGQRQDGLHQNGPGQDAVRLDPLLVGRVRQELEQEQASPWWAIDAVVAISTQAQTARRRDLSVRVQDQGLGHRLGWFPAVEHQGAVPEAIALSHRGVIADAARRRLRTVLILEDDVVFAADAEHRLVDVLAHLPAQWDLGFLGGDRPRWDDVPWAGDPDAGPVVDLAGVDLYSAHAYLVHERAFPLLLAELPADLASAHRFVDAHGPIDNWYAAQLVSGRLRGWSAWPRLAAQADQLTRRRVVLDSHEVRRFTPQTPWHLDPAWTAP
ncbi:MAG: hypothetical protein ACRC35_06025 [Angustibacter sp.]